MSAVGGDISPEPEIDVDSTDDPSDDPDDCWLADEKEEEEEDSEEDDVVVVVDDDDESDPCLRYDEMSSEKDILPLLRLIIPFGSLSLGLIK